MSDWRHEPDLSALPGTLTPSGTSLRRVRRRLEHPPGARPSRRPIRWAAIAVAACLGLVAQLYPQGDMALDSPARWSETALPRGVEVRFQGQGLATHRGDAPVIRWEQGEIELDVPHGRGLSLRVQTPEAEILDVGTRFTVARDARGTAVSVLEGRVSVTCIDGASRFLVEGQAMACPRSAAATLAVVRERQKEGAPPAETLELLNRGLARADADEAVRDELRFLSVGALEALGRPHEAREAAEAALKAGDPPRWKALASTAARLAVAEGDCAAALPWLRRLSEEGDDPVALVLLSDCLAPTRPAEAEEPLRRALLIPLTVEQRAAVVARLNALGAPINNSGSGH